MAIAANDFVDYAKQISSGLMSENSVPYAKNGGSIEEGMDCGGFIENCLRHFGVSKNYNGSNDLFRNAGSQLFELDQATANNLILPGVLCFIARKDRSKLPSQYTNDNMPDAYCVGICIGNRKVLWYSQESQCFKTATLADVPQYDRHLWTHILLCNHIDYNGVLSSSDSLENTQSDEKPMLRQGANGAHVTLLQERLISHGYSITADGSFGPKTLNAVIQFQQANGLEADGKVGPKTWATLNA